MENQDIINVGLYGGKPLFGGREERLVASVIKCGVANQCSFYQEGSCLNVRGMGESCKHGGVENIRGYTSRAQKYHSFKSKWENHDKYNQLKYPNKKVGLIGKEVVLRLSYIDIKYDTEINRWILGNPGFSSGRVVYINYNTFDSEFIKRLYQSKPQAMMGGTIESYEKEEMPLFLAHLKEVMPEKYKQFIEDFPEYDVEIDHTGRKAYIHTVKPSLIKVKRRGSIVEEWEWDGEYLTLVSDKLLMLAISREYSLESLVIKPKDKMTVEITDNMQVSKDTIFID